MSNLAGIKVDLSNNATKTDIKNISNIDTSKFALKLNLATLKNQVHKLDIDKSVPVPVDLSKLMQWEMMFLKKLCMINLLEN